MTARELLGLALASIGFTLYVLREVINVYLAAAVDRIRPKVRAPFTRSGLGDLGSDWLARGYVPRHREPVSRWSAVRVRKVAS